MMEQLLHLQERRQRQQVLIRTDAGFGTDDNLNWLLHRGYHILCKGYSGKRAAAVARRISDWQELGPQRWLAAPPAEFIPHYYRRTQTVALRWQSQKTERYKHALLICSLLDRDLAEITLLYDDRAGIENEIKADKGGLLLPRRRKKQLHAQEALMLLTDLAHNILAWTRPFWAVEPMLGDVGIYFIVNEILPIPGKIMFQDQRLAKVRLKATHPLAKPVLSSLSRILSEF